MSEQIMSLSQIMRARIDSMNSISQNITNVNTPGYKSIKSSIDSSSFNRMLNDSSSEIITTSKVDRSNGTLNVTNRPLDIAIIGDVWLGVKKSDKIYLSRNGSMTVNADGHLATKSGLPIIGENGPIELNNTHELNIMSDGTIIQNDENIGKITLYSIEDDSKLIPIGDGLYKPSGEISIASSYQIAQGALEQSNVDTGAEMVSLMETTRQIESVQRAIATYNELLNVGINQVGK
ncbi:flagellar hook basal-body protein [Teredinibacter sp. KSP-S5-2]|uniref:flagellar hook-basal body protein n=1 Tax=Teredinibacter sp. KSP-S5-2 TaxID=3034506 RepID=UPI002934416F|nr:flagellar hook basal-body protein [Teredinibacter sp. KSP-S5-2]WNO11348.1 flagellar hook basal-body protein [Teredinibacter sp. KSP-S5-2]